MNKAQMTGRLTKDVELRYTQSGTAVASFTLAVNRKFKNQNGEYEADFISVVMFQKAAETFANYTSKGSLVELVGRMQTRNYENKQGQRVYVTELVAEEFGFLESRREQQQQTQQAADPFAPDSNNAVDISDDDLPF